MYTTENFTPANFVPRRFEADHTMELRGQTISYKTVAEDNVFYDKNGKPIASIFSYSYFRTDVEDPSSRPVLFGYNGGPGSASYFVHAGFLGTKRVTYSDNITRETSLPPYEVIDNPDCLLDIADIVVVDPVGAGYGILLDEEQAGQFFGIEQDGEALDYFIEKWLHKYNRFMSPKYLVGESYGCTRNAAAAGIAASGSKTRSFNLAFDGLVMIGNTVTPGKYFGRELPVDHAVIAFQTYAAVNYYHNHPTTEQTIEEFIEEAKAFANHDYLLALYRGESLTQEEKDAIIERISYYTGCSRQYLEDRNMKIDDRTYRLEVLKDKGLSVARFDARITRPRYTPETEENTKGIFDDASSNCYSSYYLSACCGVIFPMMGIQMDRTYLTGFSTWNRATMTSSWNQEESMGTTGEQLNKAMRKTLGMRTFFANGRFDTATYTGFIDYLLTHAGLPMDRICRKNYNSGHMIYFGEDNTHELCEDIREFVLGGMPNN
ncbi:MAG: hypothetical protein HUJ69_05310 [Lachnospiraceae bacterium]|nr:hypothetical protein [Lachnospiraceae bacterium]